MSDNDPEPVMVTLQFDASDADQLVSVLAKYVVLTRSEPGCRNIDLVSSTTIANRLMIIEKWDSVEAQRSHFDSPGMVEMAKSCDGLLAKAPQIDLLEGISMHDLA